VRKGGDFDEKMDDDGSRPLQRGKMTQVPGMTVNCPNMHPEIYLKALEELRSGAEVAIALKDSDRRGEVMPIIIHATAAHGYAGSSDAYERGRPDYSAEAVNRIVSELGLGAGKVVLDAGAGTGKFTRFLVPSGARIIAVEPVAAMRHKFSSILPEIEVLAGAAEAIPLPAGSVDAVVAAQSFHWFRGAESLAEFHRVLRPGGRLGLIWNRRDESVDWMAELEKIIERHEQGAPRYKSGEWRNVFSATALFGQLRHARFGYVQSGTVETVIDRVASISFIAALPAADREQFLEEILTLIREHPATRGKAEIDIPYRTDVFTTDIVT
jgi:SAM-dependent methyltransferase